MVEDSPPPVRERLLGAADPTALLMPALLIACFFGQIFLLHDPERYVLSAQNLRAGHWDVFLTHMFMHGGLMHLLFNVGALAGLSAATLGFFPITVKGRLSVLALYLVTGVAGALAFIAMHPNGSDGAVGASGAICGLWGAWARLLAPDWSLNAARSGQVMAQIKGFAAMNLVLVVLALGLGLALGGEIGGIAWEAHMGGFIAGFFLVKPFLKLSGGLERFEVWRAHRHTQL